MPRRASSGINASVFVGIVVFVVIAAVAYFFVFKKKTSSFGDVSKLRIEEFLENGNSLRGNEYIVEGKIDEKLRWTPDRGQVVSLRVDSNGSTEMIAIEIPPEFNHLNIEREQRYSFRVRVRQGGILVATGIQRL